ncbi:hypothetical protein Ctob_010770 [Chrysochromulina tobinii]|uniref:Uncharacterized protein n=1 Tax=Chrysochromulina tobinii TaxID=1460289 RepID=A0A0M0LPL6_9EUKA|nr:hypothetical protein Ctob_010770 [Chrysochromulina tobinii]|eukprot:KOO53000.1 hypothetical protein Ctob_010770 [Chrysochromulina sp. CCMP291]
MIVSSRKVLRTVDLAYSNSDIKEALIAKLRDRAAKVLPNGAGSVAQVLAAARRLDLPVLTSPQPPSPD